MTPEQLVLIFNTFWPWGFIKIMIVILLTLYIIFAAICFRQIDLMNQVVEAQISPALRLVGLVHLGVAIFILLLALFLL